MITDREMLEAGYAPKGLTMAMVKRATHHE